MNQQKPEQAQDRKDVYEDIVSAFMEKYSWLGRQASRELLLSAASWNIEKYSNPPFRYRTHVMLAWERGWAKSTIMRAMADILGDEMVSVIGKVSDAAMRGSVSGGSFTPPKPLRTPIVISTEYGQTDFSDELLNLFLAMLEEGKTNVALNKIGQLGENQRRSLEKEYNNRIEFKENNEFNVTCDFIFWGATYDPSMLSDDALRSRLNVVTPAKPLDHEITMAADKSGSIKSMLSKTTIKRCREFLRSEEEQPTRFRPPKRLYTKYGLNLRESRDVQSYMASRNWWGLDVNPDLMEDYIEYMQESRRIATMEPEERVFDIIFDSPTDYETLEEKTGLSKIELFKVMKRIGAQKYELASDGKTKWVIWSGSQGEDDDDDEEDEFLGSFK